MVRDIYSISYKMKRDLYSRILTVLLCVFISILSVNIVMGFFIYPVHVSSDSMSPDIPENSVILVSPLLKKAERGEILLVKSSESSSQALPVRFINRVVSFFSARQFTPFAKNDELKPSLRRVIGFPGDTIYISNYLVYIKPSGQNQFLTEFELTKIKYNLTVPENTAGIDTKIGAFGNMEQTVLKEGEYFVLSDNRLEGLDSRIWGPLSFKAVEGKALFIYLPFRKARFF